MIGVLPVPRGRMSTRPCNTFSACGETTTHCRSYSGVLWRTLATLPRMSMDAKESLTGIMAPTHEKVVVNETRKKGHPLFWKEALDVETEKGRIQPAADFTERKERISQRRYGKGQEMISQTASGVGIFHVGSVWLPVKRFWQTASALRTYVFIAKM